MRRWRKKKEDDDAILTFDGLEEGEEEEEEEDEEEEEKPRRRRYAPPRPIKTRFHSDDEDEDGERGPTFDELEPKIRAGKYRPKKTDPWTAHLLYQSLRDLGEI